MTKCLTLCLVALLLAITGASVSAEHGEGGSSLSQIADVSVCGEVTLTGTNEEHLGDGTPMAFGIVWFTEDGQFGTFAIPDSHTISYEEDFNGGSVWVSYGISVGAESDWYLPHDTAVVDTNCEAEPAPIADAGLDQTVPATTPDGTDVQLDGSASTNAVTYTWTLPDATTLDGAMPAPVLFAVGTHVVTLTVANGEGVEATDTVTITVEPFVPADPIADAGGDQTVVSTNGTDAEVTLDGSGSTSPDATITAWVWATATNPTLASGETAIVTLPIGVHEITLTVTDSNANTATDTVIVTVEEEVVPPTPPSLLQVTVYCNRNPELTRVDNVGEGEVTITQVGARFGTPIAVERPLGVGRTVIFRSDSGATYGTILTTDELYADGDANEGAIVRVSTGKGFLSKCVDVDDGTPTPPSNPSLLDITLSCRTNPELTTLTNVGQRTITLVSLTTLYAPGPAEPFAIDAVLEPGESITYQSGAGATENALTTRYIYTNLAGDDDGALVRISTGKGFKATCPPRT